jgi:hypothetical protein
MERLLTLVAAAMLAGMAYFALAHRDTGDAVTEPATAADATPALPQTVPPVLTEPAGEQAPVMTDTPATPVFDEDAAKACEAELSRMGAVFEVMPAIDAGDGCGAERPLKLSSVGVPLEPAVTTRCETALALAKWTREVVVPSARLHLNATVKSMATGDSYQCRDRRGEGESKISEHARANAVDIMSVSFTDHETVAVKDWTGSDGKAAEFQAAIRGGACPYFTTVLGPGSNAAHANHLHLDLIQRKNGYRICE